MSLIIQVIKVITESSLAFCDRPKSLSLCVHPFLHFSRAGDIIVLSSNAVAWLLSQKNVGVNPNT